MQVRLCKTAGAACLLVLLLALLVIGESAAGQPTPEQVSAIKSNCRSDFMANCRGVPRGGAEAVQCLKQHLANLSAGCQNAVQAISPPAAPRPESPPAEPAPAPAAAVPETPPAAQAPETEGRQLRCLLSHRSALTPDCQGALAKLTR